MKNVLIASLLVTAISCNRREAEQQPSPNPPANAAQTASNDDDAAVPIGSDDPRAREQQRFNEEWRGLDSFRNAATSTMATDTAAANVQFVARQEGTKESFASLDAAGINAAPVMIPIHGDISGPSVLKTQVYLDRANFSVGALDGRWGRNSGIAVWWYQRSRGLDATGSVDEATFRSLAAAAGGVPALRQATLTEDDVKGPFVSIPEDVYEKAKLDCLCYETKREKLAERFHSSEDFLTQLNPNVDFDALKAGDSLWVPNVREPLTQDRKDIAKVVVSIAGSTFNGYDAQGYLVFHAPTTLGSQYDPSPRETLDVRSVTFDPHFHYQPTLFHEVPDENPEANLMPGPNSPVGVVWVALSKRHFGIHGTSDPESIGYASSHGCVRLTNWDAAEIGRRVGKGVTVEFLDTRAKN